MTGPRSATKSSLSRASAYDGVTSLPNRATFLTLAGAEFQRAARYDLDLAIVICRLEEANSNTLFFLAAHCEMQCRIGIDVLGMIGHDELAVALPHTDLTGAMYVADRIKRSVEMEPAGKRSNGEPMKVTTTSDQLEADDFTVLQLIERARMALPPESTASNDRSV